MVRRLTPIKDRILGCVQGNHEARISNRTGIDISRDIAVALGVPYRASGMLLKLMFGDNNNRHKAQQYVYFMYFTHGYGGARTASAKAVKVERSSTHIHSDCYLMGHDHLVNAAPVVYLEPDPRTHKDESGFYTGKVTAHRKVLVKANSFLKWGEYSEAGGFSPSDLTTPIIKFAGTGKPNIRVEA